MHRVLLTRLADRGDAEDLEAVLSLVLPPVVLHHDGVRHVLQVLLPGVERVPHGQPEHADLVAQALHDPLRH
eukprot:3704015-Alexandrium_andersonii.AAC.1